MGDRTHVTLYVRKQDADFTRNLYGIPPEEGEEVKEQNSLTGEQELLVYFEFEEVNYGELHDLDKLQAAGIPFESSWGQGCEYDEGVEYLRFTEQGEAKRTALYADDHRIDIDSLLRVKDDHAALVALIEERDNERQILPWTHQTEYGKRYLAKQLIAQ